MLFGFCSKRRSRLFQFQSCKVPITIVEIRKRFNNVSIFVSQIVTQSIAGKRRSSDAHKVTVAGNESTDCRRTSEASTRHFRSQSSDHKTLLRCALPHNGPASQYIVISRTALFRGYSEAVRKLGLKSVSTMRITLKSVLFAAWRKSQACRH